VSGLIAAVEFGGEAHHVDERRSQIVADDIGEALDLVIGGGQGDLVVPRTPFEIGEDARQGRLLLFERRQESRLTGQQEAALCRLGALNRQGDAARGPAHLPDGVDLGIVAGRAVDHHEGADVDQQQQGQGPGQQQHHGTGQRRGPQEHPPP
jgi:hypothetical protein